ncbi:hypothetical protein HK099_008480 [Clydaea vesicula]|uniref:Uncharacterized protein n=1 Tax=Clydaea vesicula TaxID=447962 RepID=A0AAD5TW00_9FUNG|nr:hypothetical protein HK099_008480 [Clydaea vesicula]
MSGRVMTSDLATADAVMNAIKIPNVTYSIIVNKLSKGEQIKGVVQHAASYSKYFQPNLATDYGERISNLDNLLKEKEERLQNTLAENHRFEAQKLKEEFLEQLDVKCHPSPPSPPEQHKNYCPGSPKMKIMWC